ncbi:excinuclease ABC subunit A [Candidatus Termititenax persephonae]|uniref:UvrABC system protein A n=1 Tax=Candidatus Termititenax persephonae TaxID=2218525 RepID=A0A388TI58_9BACT|nr:excinuclease ABC subunit A [Candidatus Termititenax persephonae]
MTTEDLYIKGARVHNLQNIEVIIPRNTLTVITGVSGSGKSSLAFDTIYAEGQRRYVESLSAYARLFLDQMEKPDVDFIDGLSPAISIDQKSRSKNPRSTVGTVTEIYDYFRLLFAHIGVPHCPKCGKPVHKQSAQEIADRIAAKPQGTKISILAPLVRGRKGEYTKLFEDLRKKGYLRVRVNGIIYQLDEKIPLNKNQKHIIEAVIDRLAVSPENYQRIFESVEAALKDGNHLVEVLTIAADKTETSELFSELFTCTDCDISVPEILPRTFSFNNPYGACAECKGLGLTYIFAPEKIVNPELTLAEGALLPWAAQMRGFMGQMIQSLARKYKFNLDTPFRKLPKNIQDILLHGTRDRIDFHLHSRKDESKYYDWSGHFEGVIRNLERLYHQTESEQRKEDLAKYLTVKPCTACGGKKLNPVALSVKIREKNISDLTAYAVKDLRSWIASLQLTKTEETIARQVLKEINVRLKFLADVGLDYLALGRASATLSGGEAQRIRLATQIGSGLVGVLYVLDEPSIGLHQKDNAKLLASLKHLRDLGNTVIVVEHDDETMLAADHLIDMGPGAGKLGGRIVAEGAPAEVLKNPQSLTGAFLAGRQKIPVPQRRRAGNKQKITLTNVAEHNLKKLTVSFPLGKFICITGVSGSGKSSLITDTLYPLLMHKLHGSSLPPIKYSSIKGVENIDSIIVIDQDPIGRTPRSNPATYTGVFTPIRELFALTPEAKQRGYQSGRFSFNVRGGRCEACEGDGIKKIEMHFLPDVYVPCEVCGGKRYNKETLEVRYKGHNISEVLNMTVEEAYGILQNIPQIERKLRTLRDVGLNYIQLGQSATTLSGGEAQRIKLATELSKRSTGRTLYILDEPTTGLHFADVSKLIEMLNRLVDNGNTIIVVEHNLDVVKSADHIIDLGPDGGDGGGEIIAAGTPEEVAAQPQSYTGQYLRRIL